MGKVRDFENRIFEKINPAINFSVRHYVMAIGLFVAVVVFGLVSTFGLGVDLFPQLNIPVVLVTTQYPGATPSVVDQQITQVVENQVSTLSGITDINSWSETGQSFVVMYFALNTDKNADAQEVSSSIAAIVKALPPGVNPPTVQTYDPNSAPILQFAVSAHGSSLEQAANYVQNDLTPLLERVSGVAYVQTDGGPKREFQVLLDPERLAAYNLTPQQVVGAIAGSAVNLPIGTIELHNTALSFQTQNVPADTHQIESYVVDSATGVTVRDVASVRDVGIPTDYARVNGKPVVLVSIQQTSDSNVVAVVNGVRALLAHTTLPKGYSITYSNDTTGPIRAALHSTYHELVITAIFVALVVLLFLGRLNTAFSVILAIPIALSAGPVLYHLAGYTFNLASLLALVVAIGIVVDDSIVVSENVMRYRAMGFDLQESVLRGASEVFSAVIAASLSILSVVLSVSFIGGVVGEYLRQFTFGLAAVVLFSLLEAILFLTVRLAYTPDTRQRSWGDVGSSFAAVGRSFKWGLRAWRRPVGIIVGLLLVAGIIATKHVRLVPLVVVYPLALALLYYVAGILLVLLDSITNTLHRGAEALLERVKEGYAHSLGRVLRRPRWVLFGALGFFVLTVAVAGPRVPFTFAPNSDNGTISVNLSLPPGTPESVTNTETGKVENYLFHQPYVSLVQTVVGSSGGRISSSSQTNEASLIVKLTPINTRPNEFTLIPEYRRNLLRIVKADQPAAVLQVGQPSLINANSLTLTLISPNLQDLTARNTPVLQWLQQNPEVADVSSSLSNTTSENDFVPDDQQLKGTGITPDAVATTLQDYSSGVQAGQVWIGGLSYPIMVQVNPTRLSGVQSLLSLPIHSPILGSNLEVGQLGHFVLKQSPTTITRYNRFYSANFNIDLKPGAPPILQFQKNITSQMKEAGLLGKNVSLAAGNSYGAAALSAQLAVTGPLAFALAFFFAYLVMAAQFNSWRYPVYLLLPVPLAIVGALWLLFALGIGMDVYGILGMILLIGLSAKNAIIYLDFVVGRIDRMPLIEALVESARLRFRPIVMTTLTVLVISFPLIFNSGEGAEYGRNLGIVMFGGIVFSAVLTFFVVPSAFYLFERKRLSVSEPAVKESSR